MCGQIDKLRFIVRTNSGQLSKNMKNVRIYIRVSDDFKTEIEEVSNASNKTSSEVIREAIDEKLEKLKSEPRIAKRLSNLNNEQIAKHAARVEV